MIPKKQLSECIHSPIDGLLMLRRTVVLDNTYCRVMLRWEMLDPTKRIELEEMLEWGEAALRDKKGWQQCHLLILPHKQAVIDQVYDYHIGNEEQTNECTLDPTKWGVAAHAEDKAIYVFAQDLNDLMLLKLAF